MNIDYKLDSIHEYAEKIRSYPQQSLNIIFIMTAECNFRCTYCYEFKRPDVLKLESMKRVVEKLFPIDENAEYWNGFFDFENTKDTITFDFFGGECLLEVDNMDAICDFFMKLCDSDLEKYGKRKENFKITIQTNGSLLQTPKVKRFLDKWQKYINLFITIDGTKKCHDACRVFKDTLKPTWDIVKTNLQWFRETYPHIDVSTKGTITPDNVDQLFDSYIEYQKLGFKSIKTTLGLCGIVWDEKSLNTLREQYKLISDDLLENHLYDGISFFTFDYKELDRRTNRDLIETIGCGSCGTNGCQIAITPRDEICTCHMLAYLAHGKDGETLAIGNVHDGITEDGLKNNNGVKRYIFTNFFNSDTCKHCNSRLSCEVCPGSAYAVYGKNFINNDEPFDITECAARRIEGQARLVYTYKKEALLCQKKDQ